MSPGQKRTLEHIRVYFAEHGRGPSQRTIMRDTGAASLSTINEQVRALEEYGFLRRTGEFAGAYIPVEAIDVDLSLVPTWRLRAEVERRDAEARA